LCETNPILPEWQTSRDGAGYESRNKPNSGFAEKPHSSVRAIVELGWEHKLGTQNSLLKTPILPSAINLKWGFSAKPPILPKWRPTSTQLGLQRQRNGLSGDDLGRGVCETNSGLHEVCGSCGIRGSRLRERAPVGFLLTRDEAPRLTRARWDRAAPSSFPENVKHSFQTPHPICIVEVEASSACIEQKRAASASTLRGSGHDHPIPRQATTARHTQYPGGSGDVLRPRRLASATAYTISEPLRILDD
jgi:hypothetical protein